MQNTGSTAARQKTMKTRSCSTMRYPVRPRWSACLTRMAALAGRLSRIQTAIMTTISAQPTAADRNSVR